VTDKSGYCTCLITSPNVRLNSLINFSARNHYFFLRTAFHMNQQATVFQMTRSEQETQNEAKRLIAQIEAAVATVAVRAASEDDSLDSAADRIERAARDLATALRQLADERKAANENP
jgi:hypothetical protein